MNNQDFLVYHGKPTKLITSTLNLTSQLFCQPTCLPYCPSNCQNHPPPNILLPQFISLNNHVSPLPSTPPIHPPQPIPPPKITPRMPLLKNLSIHNIINHKHIQTRDKNHLKELYILPLYMDTPIWLHILQMVTSTIPIPLYPPNYYKS
jgi:hypothetical protein